jgi:hypothetical protein
MSGEKRACARAAVECVVSLPQDQPLMVVLPGYVADGEITVHSWSYTSEASMTRGVPHAGENIAISLEPSRAAATGRFVGGVSAPLSELPVRRCDGALGQRHATSEFSRSCLAMNGLAKRLHVIGASAMNPARREKVRKNMGSYRERMRQQGLRPIRLWVPDTRSTAVAEELRRQSLTLAGDPAEREVPEWIEETADVAGWS